MRRRVRDEEEDVQRLEAARLHGEVVRSPELRAVVGEEASPGLGRRTPQRPPPVAPHRLRAHRVAERESLALDADGAPARVPGCDPRDQPLQLLADARPARLSRSALPRPVPAPRRAVPADDRLRLHDHQGGTPAGPIDGRPRGPVVFQNLITLHPRSTHGGSRPESAGSLGAAPHHGASASADRMAAGRPETGGDACRCRRRRTRGAPAGDAVP